MPRRDSPDEVSGLPRLSRGCVKEDEQIRLSARVYDRDPFLFQYKSKVLLEITIARLSKLPILFRIKKQELEVKK